LPVQNICGLYAHSVGRLVGFPRQKPELSFSARNGQGNRSFASMRWTLIDLPESMLAMSRLNSWVRSPSFRSFGGPRNAIYFLKRQALDWADSHFRCLHSTVITLTTCRGCAGTGKYTDSYGHTFDHCRACSNRGTLSLLFVQTLIEDKMVWHTPWMKFYIRGKSASPPYNLARWTDDWKVNEPGKDLTPAEAARDLNTVECFWPDRQGAWTSNDFGMFFHFDYRLHVGATERKCTFCGSTEVQGSFGVTRETVQWSDHCCRSCESIVRGTHGNVFDAFPLPWHLLRDPQIELWMARHTEIRREIAAAKKKEAYY
jgi:hypothetical protein